jgi:diketogulonate reductase-like aldo/keto reductase
MGITVGVIAGAAGHPVKPSKKTTPASHTPPVPPTDAPSIAKTPEELLTRPIPSTNERIPAIGLGTWQTFDVDPTPDKLAPLDEVLTAFSELGGTVIDSSPMYGRSEDVVGRLIDKHNLRDKLFVATKVWTKGKEAGIAQMEESETKLRAKPLDLMQVHNLVDVEPHLPTLRAWKKEKRIRYLGITHYAAAHHDHVARIVEKEPLDFVQINYSIGEREAEARLLPLCRDRGVAVIAHRPFVSGALLKKLAPLPLPEWAAEIDCDSWAQLLLKFIISHPAITCAIPATSKVKNLRDNMKECRGRLPDEPLRARIAAIAS